MLNLNIPQYKDSSVQVEQINDPILKIIEKVIHDQTQNFLNERNIIFRYQSRFRKKIQQIPAFHTYVIKC